MAITAMEAEKRLGQHLIDAANSITPEVAKTVYAKVLDLMEIQRERFMTVTDAVGEDYRESFVAWIKGEGEIDAKLADEWHAIFGSTTQYGNSPHEAQSLQFPATYFYRTGEFGSGEDDTFALRLGWIHVYMPAAAETRNPLEMAVRDYIVGITNDHKKVISAMTSQLRTKAQAAVKNHSVAGVTNYVYNQYVKGLDGNPFVDRRIGLDLFTNEEVTGLYSGTAAGTDTARNQMKYKVQTFARELREPDSLAGYGVSGSLYSLMMTRFINEGEWSELYSLFTEDMVEQWNESREFAVHRGNNNYPWRHGIFESIDNRLKGEAKTEFRQHCWDNVLSDAQRDEVISATLNHFGFDPLKATGANPHGVTSLVPFEDLVTEADALNFLKKKVILTPAGYNVTVPAHLASTTLADIAPVVIYASLDERGCNWSSVPSHKQFEHLSGQRIRYIYNNSEEMGPVALANQAAIFAEGLLFYEDDYYVIDDSLRVTLKTWMTMDGLISPEHMDKIKRLDEIAHDVDACDYDLYRYYQTSYGAGEIELLYLDVATGSVIAFRK